MQSNKPLSRPLVAAVIALEEGWERLKVQGIDVLCDLLSRGMVTDVNPFPPGLYTKLYTLCYEMCTQRAPNNWSEQLYQRHAQTITEYLQKRVVPALSALHGAAFLAEFAKHWQNHLIMNKWMRLFFMYLDRHFVRHHNLPSLAESGMNRYRAEIYDRFRGQVTEELIVLINRERSGESVDRDILRGCIEVFDHMGQDCYMADLHAPVVAATRAYYASKASAWLVQESGPQYLMQVERELQLEEERMSTYMLPHSVDQLRNVVLTELLERHVNSIVSREGSGVRAMLEKEREADLSRLFKLFLNVPAGLEPIAAVVRTFMEDTGMEIVRARADAPPSKGGAESASGAGAVAGDTEFVQQLLALHTRFSRLVDDVFAKHRVFQAAMNAAFDSFMNKDTGKATNAELLSCYLDRVLRAGGEKVAEDKLEQELEGIVSLFVYLSDKDLFAEVYRNQLARRLLNHRVASVDAERAMISKLKLRCGSQYTAKLEGMLTDIRAAQIKSSSFSSAAKAAHSSSSSSLSGVEFDAVVLTQGHWPSMPSLDLRLPPVLEVLVNAFSAHFASHNSHRRLVWAHTLGHASVRAHFPRRQHELGVNTLQMAALLLFNADKASGAARELTLAQVAELMNVDADTAKRVMHSLSCGKYRVLAKEPDDRVVRATDTFRVNAAFSCPLRNVRLPMASLEPTHNPKKVQEDRGHAIEAAVVRIMKSRKTLDHAQLVAEVFRQLATFRPNVKVIKQKIEHLIEREYLERDGEHSQTYRYLA